MQRYHFYLILILLSLSACSKEIKQAQTLDLNGAWQFKQADKEGWTKATVPGVVQLDMLNAGLIDDPFYGLNENKIGWIELENWEYQRNFEVSEALLAQDVIDLVLEGLDTYAEVRVNGKSLLKADNMFCTWRVNCKAALKLGENTINILFKSPIREKEGALKDLGYTLPAGNDAGQFKVSPFVRKAPYQFGWDWGPRIVTMGIWRPIRLEAHSLCRVEDVYFNQVTVNSELAQIQTEITLHAQEQEELELIVRNAEKVLVQKTVSSPKGNQKHLLSFDIENPKLWWSRGLGEAHLYEWTVEIKKGAQVLYSKGKKVGLRKIELIQEADSIGTSYYFKLNGKPVFMKGANYIPQDNLLPRVSDKQYQQVIQNAVDANMNMLRVWGGGIYEKNLFYELCDENGLLVWQDFMFACGMYPSDDAFLANVKKEVEQNVQRLRNYACIALWCGNNEMEVAWNNWGWQQQFGYSKTDSTTIIEGYKKLFHDLIPTTVEGLNTNRPYVSTSPLSNWGTPENFNHKSMHYWGVWHGREAFEEYKNNVGRFMSEYGFQSFPAMKTIEAFADSTQWNLDSEVMQHHQKSYIGNGMIQKHLETYFPRPKNFSEFVYLSQLTQAHGVAMAIESHRQSQGHCMGSLYWQINDCWTGPSWSSVDYFGRWKALHYKVRALYQDVLLSAEETAQNALVLKLVSDKGKDLEGTLTLELLKFDATLVALKQVKDIKIAADSKGNEWEFDLKELLGHFDTKEVVLRMTFAGGGKVESHLAQQLYYFEAPKHLKLQAAELEKKLQAVEGGYALSLKANTLVKNLFIELEGTAHCSDNYVDLLANKEKIIKITSKEKLNVDQIKFLSINDLLSR